MNRDFTICYFGSFDPYFSRNRIYRKGLIENGVKIIDCADNTKGFLKFFHLFKKHKKVKKAYDILLIGYPGHITVPFAKIISRKPVVLDALCTLWEAESFSHGANLFRRVKYRIIDWLAVKFSDAVLVESEAQKKFFIQRFGGNSDKYKVVYTGADDSLFYKDASVKKNSQFTVLFRGRLTPESGIGHVIDAAEILKNKNVDFKIIGFGLLLRKVKNKIAELKLPNVELVFKYLNTDELRKEMLECHASLGQFENNDRLNRTIPHKAFESLAMGLPYITGRAEGISDLLKDGENCLLVNLADPKDLAEKILELKNNPDLAKKIAESGLRLFKEKLNPDALARKIIICLKDCLEPK